MSDPNSPDPRNKRLRAAVVVRVREDVCEIVGDGQQLSRARYAPPIPTPRTERLSPGHLVAIGSTSDGADVVMWRWYDAVVIGAEDGLLRMWEPAHGELLAQQRRAAQTWPPGTRAYLSAGLPGADWWVAGPVPTPGGSAEVELDEVARLYTENDLWAEVD